MSGLRRSGWMEDKRKGKRRRGAVVGEGDCQGARRAMGRCYLMRKLKWRGLRIAGWAGRQQRWDQSPGGAPLWSLCGNITHTAPPCDTHITHPCMVEFGCGSVGFFFLSYQSETTKKDQCKSFGSNAQLRHKQTTLCNSDRARFIHCVILIFLLRYTVIAWSIPFETFSMGFVCLFVLQGSCFLTCMRRRVTNEWFTLDCFPAVQCVNGSFSFITFVWKEKYFSLAFCMELISLAFNYFTNSNELIHNNHLILIY